MRRDFKQISWDEETAGACRNLIRLAVWEDTQGIGDWTTMALVAPTTLGRAALVARQEGMVAGLLSIPLTIEAIDPQLSWHPLQSDSDAIKPGDCLGHIDGPAAGLLIAERLVLNIVGHLSGIATMTSQYVEEIEGTPSRIYSTRKTTPGWRLLEKHAVRCGGGYTHRSGLHVAVLIKDNHLALGAQESGKKAFTPAEAVERAREYVQEHASESTAEKILIEIEVDTLDQLDGVLPTEPDIILLDNMPPDVLREAIRRRDAAGVATELEASGGITLKTIRAVAETGVERISVGALTHSAIALDVGLDWDP